MKYKLERSQTKNDGWVLTDVENLIVIEFIEHKFNETQMITPLDDESLLKRYSPNQIASILKDMGNYMTKYHGNIAFAEKYGWRLDEDDNIYFCRFVEPRFSIKIEDKQDKATLIASLKKAVEWLNKRDGRCQRR